VAPSGDDAITRKQNPKSPSRNFSDQHRVGRRIRAREVRVIDEAGNMLGIMDTREASDRAEAAGLQLVEVNSKAVPPVCKIMDYGRFKYEVAKRDRDARKHQKIVDVKEVKFRPKTGDHDYETKVRHARRFLEEGDKVRLLVQFRGREVVHPETGRVVLERVCRDLADVATVAQIASQEGPRLSMILAPKARKDTPRPRKQPDEAPGARASAPPTAADGAAGGAVER
jgi:translation initiation factor IF-3